MPQRGCGAVRALPSDPQARPLWARALLSPAPSPPKPQVLEGRGAAPHHAPLQDRQANARGPDRQAGQEPLGKRGCGWRGGSTWPLGFRRFGAVWLYGLVAGFRLCASCRQREAGAGPGTRARARSRPPTPISHPNPTLLNPNPLAGIFNTKQLALALFDQTVHTTPSANTTETYARVMKEVTRTPPQDGTHPAARFNHLIGYNAQARQPGGRGHLNGRRPWEGEAARPLPTPPARPHSPQPHLDLPEAHTPQTPPPRPPPQRLTRPS